MCVRWKYIVHSWLRLGSRYAGVMRGNESGLSLYLYEETWHLIGADRNRPSRRNAYRAEPYLRFPRPRGGWILLQPRKARTYLRTSSRYEFHSLFEVDFRNNKLRGTRRAISGCRKTWKRASKIPRCSYPRWYFFIAITLSPLAAINFCHAKRWIFRRVTQRLLSIFNCTSSWEGSQDISDYSVAEGLFLL